MQYYQSSRYNSFPPVIKNLIIINVIVFVANEIFLQRGINLEDKLALHYFTSHLFNPFQFITHMFMHAPLPRVEHILFNMYALWMFGAPLENAWGGKRFLTFYLICGIGGGLLYNAVNGVELYQLQQTFNHFLQNPSTDQWNTLLAKYQFGTQEAIDKYNALIQHADTLPARDFFVQVSNLLIESHKDVSAVGASGAVFGILAAFGMLFGNTEMALLFFPIPIRAKYFVLIYAAVELYLGVTGTDPGVAHFAHIGGALFGFILVKIWQRSRGRFY